MVWGDQRPLLTRGIELPAGVYLIEAEDTQYSYFQAPRPLEYRTFEQGQTANDRFKKGGIFLSKTANDTVPAGVYLSGENGTKKTLIWKLDIDFLHSEGSRWTKNF